mgnify:CR=1 FL=1
MTQKKSSSLSMAFLSSPPSLGSAFNIYRDVKAFSQKGRNIIPSHEAYLQRPMYWPFQNDL